MWLKYIGLPLQILYHFLKIVVYLPAIDFLHDAKMIFSAAVEIFCILMYCEISEKPPSSAWGTEGVCGKLQEK